MTPEGKARSSRNARRHGLAVPLGRDPRQRARIEELARLLAASDGQASLPAARIAAEADLEIERVRALRFDLMRAMQSSPDERGDAVSRLTKLDRYERRALSRRNRGLRMVSSR
jgi:hypothetical protein